MAADPGNAKNWLASMLAWKDQVSAERKAKLSWYIKYAERYGVNSPFTKEFLHRMKHTDYKDMANSGTAMVIEAARTDHIRDEIEINKHLKDTSPLRGGGPATGARRPPKTGASRPPGTGASRNESARPPGTGGSRPPATGGARPPATGVSRAPETAESLERRMDELVAQMMAEREAAQAAQAGLARASSTPLLQPAAAAAAGPAAGEAGLTRMKSTPALGGRVSTAEVRALLDDEDLLVLLPPIGPKTVVPRRRKLVPLPEEHDVILPSHKGWFEPAKPKRISDFFSPLDNRHYYESSEWTYQARAAQALRNKSPSALTSPTPTVYNMKQWTSPERRPQGYRTPPERPKPVLSVSPAPYA